VIDELLEKVVLVFQPNKEYGIRLPKSIIDAFPLNDKQKLDVKIEGDKIIFTRPKEPQKSPMEYLDEYGWDGETPELSGEEREWLDAPPAVGEEIQW